MPKPELPPSREARRERIAELVFGATGENIPERAARLFARQVAEEMEVLLAQRLMDLHHSARKQVA